jgi:hypothetical protein
LGGEVWPTTPQSAREFIAAELNRWSKLVAQLGLKAE